MITKKNPYARAFLRDHEISGPGPAVAPSPDAKVKAIAL
jgi:hypothetical protein